MPIVIIRAPSHLILLLPKDRLQPSSARPTMLSLTTPMSIGSSSSGSSMLVRRFASTARLIFLPSSPTITVLSAPNDKSNWTGSSVISAPLSFSSSPFSSPVLDPNADPDDENGQRLPNGLLPDFSEFGWTGSGLSRIFSRAGSMPDTKPPVAPPLPEAPPSTSGMAKSPNSSSSISSSSSSSSPSSSLSSLPSPNLSTPRPFPSFPAPSVVVPLFLLALFVVLTTLRHQDPRFHALLPVSSSSSPLPRPISPSSLPDPLPSSSSAKGLRERSLLLPGALAARLLKVPNAGVASLVEGGLVPSCSPPLAAAAAALRFASRAASCMRAREGGILSGGGGGGGGGIEGGCMDEVLAFRGSVYARN
ncbi:hypothetical protein B0T19DRAFT_287321 [Cercophora scortea]|uniref:Uncharacterized protein n=1 Tax=Cercophora scortea TaxID=314031 RepID=A0AAE0I2E6_9PEZI|nr:hypothetical protein B0T19DRAFT_287321 [Cercophora scortea]